MTKLASAALAAILCSAPAWADAPAPAQARPAEAKREEAPKPPPAKPAPPKPAGKPAPPQPAAGSKDAPCEPVKPCPIE